MTNERLVLYTPDRESISLAGWYARRSVFLTLSGPSLASHDLSQLNRRGIVSFGVNNSWAVHRPTLWTCVDPPGRFCDRGWKDPGITKFVPHHHRDARLRVKEDGGRFRPSQFRAREMPATFFYHATTDFEPDEFFHSVTVPWGRPSKTADSLGIAGGRSVMLAALRLVHYLGFRTVYLLGADFTMSTDAKQNYAFAQDRTVDAVKHNNRLYSSLDARLAALRERAVDGFRVFNCTPGSRLTAFEHMSFDEAVQRASRKCNERDDGQLDAAGWYDKPPLDARRSDERSKYAELARTRPDYGATNHGAAAVQHIVNALPDGGRVIDLGCGRNQLAASLREQGISATGVDFAFDEADITAPMHQVPLDDGCAAVVTAFDSLEHLLPDEVDDVLAEIDRLLAPGGTFVASISHRPSRNKVKGEGLHPTVKPAEWWSKKLTSIGTVDRLGRYWRARKAVTS